MAELSRPWSGTVTGDAGPYSDDQWTDVWKTLLAPVIASQGVFRDQLNDLIVSLPLTPSPITVQTGRALVNGIWYESNINVSVAIPTPAGNPRVDRIVLRADWALQTVRITRIAGAEAASPVPPALVQIDGTTWDLPLWQIRITVGAATSVERDEREFIGQYVPTGVTDERVYLEEEFFLPTTAMVDGEFINSSGISITGDWVVNAFGGFGSGAATLRAVSAGAGSAVDIQSREHRPELISAHLIIRAKQPATDANLDRVLGFLDSAISLTPTNGVFFRADGVGNWFAVTRAAGVETTTDTGQALDDVWRKFEIRQTEDDVVVFLIDDVVVANHTSDIPGADMSLREAIFDDGSGGAAGATDYMNVDYHRLAGDRV